MDYDRTDSYSLFADDTEQIFIDRCDWEEELLRKELALSRELHNHNQQTNQHQFAPPQAFELSPTKTERMSSLALYTFSFSNLMYHGVTDLEMWIKHPSVYESHLPQEFINGVIRWKAELSYSAFFEIFLADQLLLAHIQGKKIRTVNDYWVIPITQPCNSDGMIPFYALTQTEAQLTLSYTGDAEIILKGWKHEIINPPDMSIEEKTTTHKMIVPANVLGLKIRDPRREQNQNEPLKEIRMKIQIKDLRDIIFLAVRGADFEHKSYHRPELEEVQLKTPNQTVTIGREDFLTFQVAYRTTWCIPLIPEMKDWDRASQYLNQAFSNGSAIPYRELEVVLKYDQPVDFAVTQIFGNKTIYYHND